MRSHAIKTNTDIPLSTSDTMSQLLSNGLVEKLCDNIFADLKVLCDEAHRQGMDNVERLLNSHNSDSLYVSSHTWRPPQGPHSWYHGFYVGFGLNQSGRASLGFLATPTIRELCRRLREQQLEVYEPPPREIRTIGSPVTINDLCYRTPDGTFMVTSTHSWYIHTKLCA